MTRKLILIKHSRPQVVPEMPAEQWILSEEGRQLCRPLAEKIAAHAPEVIVSSEETKAKETATLLAEILGKPHNTAPGLGEHDRSNVPYMPSREFISYMALFFQQPQKLVLGRESAAQAQARFDHAIDDVLSAHPTGNIAVVTHGTVLSLFAAAHAGLDGFRLWRSLGLPSFMVFSAPELKLMEQVDRIA